MSNSHNTFFWKGERESYKCFRVPERRKRPPEGSVIDVELERTLTFDYSDHRINWQIHNVLFHSARPQSFNLVDFAC